MMECKATNATHDIEKKIISMVNNSSHRLVYEHQTVFFEGHILVHCNYYPEKNIFDGHLTHILTHFSHLLFIQVIYLLCVNWFEMKQLERYYTSYSLHAPLVLNKSICFY